MIGPDRPQMKADYLIIGSGLTGSVIARNLTDAGCRVLVLDRRSHFGGNVYDQVHLSGIRMHTYGPHYFRTNDEKIWAFVHRFSLFYKYVPILKSWVDGHYENWPIAASYICKMAGEKWEPGFKGVPSHFEEAALAMMPRVIYEKFVKGYNEKQWGVPANSLWSHLAKRFDVRMDDQPQLMRHKYQGLPENGYADFMQKMLAGIPVILHCDYLKHPHAFEAHKGVVFTGPIDEYFGYDLGRLKYRGQRREHEYFPDVKFLQPVAQVNNPDHAQGAHIRTLEWKHMMPAEYAQKIQGSVLTREIPRTPEDPDQYEYPFPDCANAELYKLYQKRAQRIKNLLFCGRLGEYRYYDMDQAIGRAMILAERLLSGQ